MWIAVHVVSATLSQAGSPVLEAAWVRFQRELIVEGAGIFWIVAELGILFAVTVGRRVLRERPLPERLILTRSERWLALGLVLVAVGLAALVFGRFLIWAPMPIAIEATAGLDRPEIPRAVYAELTGHARVHLAIWCAFIAVWIALEIAIVAQGIRAFHALASLTRSGRRRLSVNTALGLAAGTLVLIATDASAQFTHAIEMAMQTGYRGGLEDIRPGYRFVELYVRVAGAVWVVVEWIAAVYLVRGYFMLRRFFRERAHVA